MKKIQLRGIVFVSGFCLMLVQVVSGRALAPYVGTSVYTWTNIIATTLLAIVAGNYLGGIIADQKSGKFSLGATLAAGGAAAVLSNYLLIISDQLFGQANLHIALRSMLYAFGAFFPVALCLSAVMPQAVRLDMRALESAGRSVGSLSFWSSLGSILGTFSGGFILISAVGTKRTLFLVAMGLMILGIAVAQSVRLWRNRIALLVGLFLIGDIFVPSPCTDETNYYCIRIGKEIRGGEEQLTLKLDHLLHSYVNPEAPGDLGYGYEQVYANLIAMRYRPTSEFSTYFIGGGGYVLPRYVEAHYPAAHVRVAEIDPGVTKINRERLGLSEETKIESVHRDARFDLQRGGGPYDLVFGDAFNDFTVPFHLTTIEFHELLKSRMNEDGVYALNIIDDRRHGAFLAAMIRTLREVWTHVYVAPQSETLSDGRNTVVLIATDRKMDESAWYGATTFSNPDRILTLDRAAEHATTLLSEEEIEAFLREHSEPSLRDDFVPVERYLAPVFRDAY